MSFYESPDDEEDDHDPFSTDDEIKEQNSDSWRLIDSCLEDLKEHKREAIVGVLTLGALGLGYAASSDVAYDIGEGVTYIV